MYQDILPHHYHNEYLPVAPKDGDIVFGYDGPYVLMKKDETFYHYEELPKSQNYQYLFEIDNTHFYQSDLSKQETIKVNFTKMRIYKPKHLAFACITGWQLYQWQQTNQYCGRCGAQMVPDTKERAMRCTKCGNIVYPKIMPAVIVGVTNEKGQILLTRYARGSYRKLALVAGFAEIGETIEECVKREVKEETNLDVTDLTFYKTQPWSFSSTLLFGFWAKASSTQEIKREDGELAEAAWYDKDVNVDELDEASLTAEMIRAFKKGL